MGKYLSYDIKVIDSFIDKFAERYINQRSALLGVDSTTLKSAESLNCNFNTSHLLEIIRKNAISVDEKREQGEHNIPFKDIYRSDLGELLTTYYFEEKVGEEDRFIIPLKNISYRERPDMPGKGFDAIGYRKEKDGKIALLIGEAKVSNSKTNPPSVVDQTNDSIYQTHKKHHDDTPLVLQRLTDYVRRLGGEDIVVIGCLVCHMANKQTDNYTITYGCGLVRDYECVDKDKDYGKMQANEPEFTPGKIHFAIFSFTDKTIEETVDLFYHRVQELVK